MAGDQPVVRKPRTRREARALRDLLETGAIPIIVNDGNVPTATQVAADATNSLPEAEATTPATLSAGEGGDQIADATEARPQLATEAEIEVAPAVTDNANASVKTHRDSAHDSLASAAFPDPSALPDLAMPLDLPNGDTYTVVVAVDGDVVSNEGDAETETGDTETETETATETAPADAVVDTDDVASNEGDTETETGDSEVIQETADTADSDTEPAETDVVSNESDVSREDTADLGANGESASSDPIAAATETDTTIAAVSQPTSPAHPPAAIATARSMVKIYGKGETEVKALAGVDVDFYSGELTAIMGPSGSGKSTLMHCMAGLDKVTRGEVIVADMNISSMSERQLTIVRRKHVGFVFQAYNLVPTLTARENIRLPLDIACRAIDNEWFELVVTTLGLSDRLRHRPAELSGGQQQRVAIARALISRPAVVFADEPTGNLDSQAAREVLGFLRQGADDMDQAIVMVTHDPTAASYAHRVIFLADGLVVGELANPTVEAILDFQRT